MHKIRTLHQVEFEPLPLQNSDVRHVVIMGCTKLIETFSSCISFIPHFMKIDEAVQKLKAEYNFSKNYKDTQNITLVSGNTDIYGNFIWSPLTGPIKQRKDERFYVNFTQRKVYRMKNKLKEAKYYSSNSMKCWSKEMLHSDRFPYFL
jgi:hypothetical protein